MQTKMNHQTFLSFALKKICKQNDVLFSLNEKNKNKSDNSVISVDFKLIPQNVWKIFTDLNLELDFNFFDYYLLDVLLSNPITKPLYFDKISKILM